MDAAFASLRGPFPDGDACPIDPGIVDQAVAWYVKLSSGVETTEDRSAFALWRNANPEHERAWQRLEKLGRQLRGSTSRIASSAARKVLGAPEVASPARRRLLRTLMITGATTSAVWLLQDQISKSNYLADVRTAVGERRNVVLEDGTQLLLNTASAIDVRFSAQERRVELRDGEIMVTTAADAQGRPFVLATRDGTLTPLGTRFTVRRLSADDRSELAVLAGQVEVRPKRNSDAVVTVSAGQQVSFTQSTADSAEQLGEAAQSWTDGILTAERTRLADFLAELSRYRPGHLRCDPAVANLRITGAYPLAGPDASERILVSLETTLPIRINRFTRYWVTVAPR